jgi:hypothetical protein
MFAGNMVSFPALTSFLNPRSGGWVTSRFRFPGVWSGAYKGEKGKENKHVTIKVARYCELGHFQRIKKVRYRCVDLIGTYSGINQNHGG